MHNFQIKYQESSIGFENLAHLQSIQNKGDIYGWLSGDIIPIRISK